MDPDLAVNGAAPFQFPHTPGKSVITEPLLRKDAPEQKGCYSYDCQITDTLYT